MICTRFSSCRLTSRPLASRGGRSLISVRRLIVGLLAELLVLAYHFQNVLGVLVELDGLVRVDVVTSAHYELEGKSRDGEMLERLVKWTLGAYFD